MTLRLGVLGAARIAPNAVIKPARSISGVEVTSVAARDRGRAATFARKHRIAKVHRSYASMLGDPDVDAVYIPLPNGLHGAWTLRALVAGKHVLCEKPFTANAEEAREVAEVWRSSECVAMEAFHWRYHAMARRMIDVVQSAELGAIQRINVNFCIPVLAKSDIRYDLGLAGGATMDMGCYAVSWLRHLMGAEPTVVAAQARTARPGVDHSMTAELAFADGPSAGLRCSMSPGRPRLSIEMRGNRGTMRAFNPVAPQYTNRLTVKTDQTRRRERVKGESSYAAQLRAFVAAVADGGSVPTDPDDAVANMAVIDALYEAAGLGRRSPTVGPEQD